MDPPERPYGITCYYIITITTARSPRRGYVGTENETARYKTSLSVIYLIYSRYYYLFFFFIVYLFCAFVIYTLVYGRTAVKRDCATPELVFRRTRVARSSGGDLAGVPRFSERATSSVGRASRHEVGGWTTGRALVSRSRRLFVRREQNYRLWTVFARRRGSNQILPLPPNKKHSPRCRGASWSV